MNQLHQASQILNSHAPAGERLAYLNPAEEALLKANGGSGHEHLAGTGIPTYGFLSDLWDNTLGNNGLGGMITGRKARKAAEAQNAENQRLMTEAEENQQRLLDESNNAGLASNLISKGKMGLVDFTDPDAVSAGLKELEGSYIDPFPEYLRPAGDSLIGGINDTAETFNNLAGSASDRMNNFQGTQNLMSDMNQSAISKLSEIYDGGMESKLKGFNSQSDAIANRLKGLNTSMADSNYGLQQNVLSEGDKYADSLGASIDKKVDLANQQFDALNRIPGLMKAQNSELSDRFKGTMGAELNRNQEVAGRYGDTLSSQVGAAGGIQGAELSAADMILNAERAKALALGDEAENLANARQRSLRSAMVGQGGGTDMNMGNAMIRAQLGQQRSDLLADALIRDAERRGSSGINYAGRIGDAEIGRSNKLENVLDNNATLGYMNKMEQVLDTNADLEGANINADRFAALGEINPAMADVYKNEAKLGNANTALGFGDGRIAAAAQNLGIDQGMIDSDQSLYNSVMGQQLANTGMIPGLGMQEAMLPSLTAEAGLAPQGVLAKNVSPFTSTGTLPAGNANFNSQPYTPAPMPQETDWLEKISKIPDAIDKGKDAYGKIKDIFS